MENLIIKPTGTPESTKAMAVYFNIENAKTQVANAMVELCRNLKTMRDKKLYKELGFDKFETYVEQAHGIKQRQAYTYIQTYEKLTPQLMTENADLGITKLSLLCQVSAIDREKFAENNDLANISVAEMEKLIEEKNGLHQQISLLQDKAADNQMFQKSQNKEIERLKKEISEKNKTIKELSSQPVTIDAVSVSSEIVEEAVLKARKEFEIEKAEAVREERKIAKEKFDKEKQSIAESNRKYILKATEEAVIKAKKEWEAEQQDRQSQLETAVADAQNKAAALEKQLAIKGDDKTVRFSILFEQVQTDLISCINLVNEISAEDAEKAEKYKAALRKACDMALGGE